MSNKESDYVSVRPRFMPRTYRFVIFNGDLRDACGLETFIVSRLCTATWGDWYIYRHRDGSDRWMLKFRSWEDRTKTQVILKGASLCFLACWLAKRYRECYLDVGCFVEEVSL